MTYAGRLLVVLLLAASLAAGCGGDDGGGGGSSATEWADELCTAITDWTESITSATESITGGEPSEESLRNAVDDIAESTSDFVDEVKGLGAPDTEAGDEAKETVDQLADDVDGEIEKIRSAAENASGVSGVLEAFSTITGALSTMGQQVASGFSDLEQLDPQGELENAFEDADSCQDLRERAEDE
jgi:uncharacterized protein YoxC